MKISLKWNILLLFIVSTLFSGCISTKFPVGIDANYSSLNTTLCKVQKTKISIIGVYDNTNENKAKVIDALSRAKDQFKPVNKLISTKGMEDQDRVFLKCAEDTQAGFFGRYNNVVERDQIVNNCFEKRAYRTVTIYNGHKVSFINNALTKEKFFNATMLGEFGNNTNTTELQSIGIFAKIIGNKIVVYEKMLSDMNNKDIFKYIKEINNEIVINLKKTDLINTQTNIDLDCEKF